MPYIKPVLRPLFDAIYNHATYLDTRPDLYSRESVANEVLDALGQIDEVKRTACLNYFFTKTLRYCFNNKTAPLLIRVFRLYFMDQPSYRNFEAANGFIHRIQKEFNRRKWSTHDTIYILDFLEQYIDMEADDFEAAKQVENGDV